LCFATKVPPPRLAFLDSSKFPPSAVQATEVRVRPRSHDQCSAPSALRGGPLRQRVRQLYRSPDGAESSFHEAALHAVRRPRLRLCLSVRLLVERRVRNRRVGRRPLHRLPLLRGRRSSSASFAGITCRKVCSPRAPRCARQERWSSGRAPTCCVKRIAALPRAPRSSLGSLMVIAGTKRTTLADVDAPGLLSDVGHLLRLRVANRTGVSVRFSDMTLGPPSSNLRTEVPSGSRRNASFLRRAECVYGGQGRQGRGAFIRPPHLPRRSPNSITVVSELT
jgi:hypothetical protein